MRKTAVILSLFVLMISFAGCAGDQSAEDTDIQEQEQQEQTIQEEQEEEVAQEEVQEEISEPEAEEIEEETAEPAAEASTESPEIKLAKCMTEKGTTLYTATWCGHCQNQKDAFKEGVDYLENVECSAMDGWSIACKDAGIRAVPTWILPDGTMKTGAMPLEKLADLTGCPYNS